MDSLHDSNKDRDEVLKRFVSASMFGRYRQPKRLWMEGQFKCPTGDLNY